MSRLQRQTIAEIAVMIAAVVAMGAVFFPEDRLFLDANPHPFWLIILLVSIRYGSPASLYAAVPCAVLHLWGLSARGLRLQEALHLGATEALVPVMYVLIALLLGGRFQQMLNQNTYFRQMLEQAQRQERKMESDRTQLERSYRELEGRIAEQSDTMGSFYDAAKGMDTDVPKRALAALRNILSGFLGASRVSVWKHDGNLWVPDEETAPGADGMPHVAELARQKAKIVTILDLGEKERGRGDALMAGPVFVRADRMAYLVAVHEMPFERFTRRSIRLFGMILDWASRSFERQELLAMVRQRDVFESRLGLTSEVFFRTSVAQKHSLMCRQKEAESILFLGLPGGIEEAVRQRLRVVLAAVLRNILRNSDTPAWFPREDAFVVYMPATAPDNGGIVLEKIDGALQALGLHPWRDNRPLFLCAEVKAVLPADEVDDVLAAGLSALKGMG